MSKQSLDLINNFKLGMIRPELLQQWDTDFPKQGVELLENFVPLEGGGIHNCIRTSSPLQYGRKVSIDGAPSRMFSYMYNELEYFLIIHINDELQTCIQVEKSSGTELNKADIAGNWHLQTGSSKNYRFFKLPTPYTYDKDSDETYEYSCVIIGFVWAVGHSSFNAIVHQEKRTTEAPITITNTIEVVLVDFSEVDPYDLLPENSSTVYVYGVNEFQGRLIIACKIAYDQMNYNYAKDGDFLLFSKSNQLTDFSSPLEQGAAGITAEQSFYFQYNNLSLDLYCNLLKYGNKIIITSNMRETALVANGVIDATNPISIAPATEYGINADPVQISDSILLYSRKKILNISFSEERQSYYAGEINNLQKGVIEQKLNNPYTYSDYDDEHGRLFYKSSSNSISIYTIRQDQPLFNFLFTVDNITIIDFTVLGGEFFILIRHGPSFHQENSEYSIKQLMFEPGPVDATRYLLDRRGGTGPILSVSPGDVRSVYKSDTDQYMGEFTADENGDMDIEYYGSVYHGYPIVSKATIKAPYFPLAKSRHSKYLLNLMEAGPGLQIGPDYDNLEEINLRSAADGFDTPEFTGVKEVLTRQTAQAQQDICLYDDSPLPKKILSIYGVKETNG